MSEMSELPGWHKAPHWVVHHLICLGIAAAGCYSRDESALTFRGKRIMFLYWPRWKWRCVLRFHHWPTPYTVVFDLCGKCCQWPCCGSITFDHVPGCSEATA